MKDLSDASFVLGIEIGRDRSRGMLGLSQKAYVDRVPKRINMNSCSLAIVNTKSFKSHCANNYLEKEVITNSL